MFAKVTMNARDAFEISNERAKEEEMQILKDVIRDATNRYNTQIQVDQADYKVIDLETELYNLGVPYTANAMKRYDLKLYEMVDEELSDRDPCWFDTVLSNARTSANAIVASVQAYINAAAKNYDTKTVWHPDGNNEMMSFNWLIRELEKNGFHCELDAIKTELTISWNLND